MIAIRVRGRFVRARVKVNITAKGGLITDSIFGLVT